MGSGVRRNKKGLVSDSELILNSESCKASLVDSKNKNIYICIYLYAFQEYSYVFCNIYRGADIRPALSDVFAAGDAGFPNQSGAGDVYD